MAAYLSWSWEILVCNVAESMTWSESKQIFGYIFTCSIALAPSLTLFAGFTIQTLIIVPLCRLASTEEGSYWEYGSTCLQLRFLRKNLGRRGTTDIFCHNLHVACYNIGHIGAWLPGLKYLKICKLALIGRPLGLSTSDNNENNKKENVMLIIPGFRTWTCNLLNHTTLKLIIG